MLILKITLTIMVLLLLTSFIGLLLMDKWEHGDKLMLYSVNTLIFMVTVAVLVIVWAI